MMIDIIINVIAWSLLGVSIWWNIKDVKVKTDLINSNNEIKTIIEENTEHQKERIKYTKELIDIINEVAHENNV